MTSSRADSLNAQEPRIRVAPRRGRTLADLAADFSAGYGLTPDQWQRHVLDDWLGETSGRWSSLTCALSVPRQNGKNALLEMRELFGMVGLGEKILHTAHQVKTAQKHFRRLKEFFGTKADDPAAKYPELNALVREIRNVNGQEAIYLSNGGSVELVARSVASGRGFTVDILVMDEAQDMADEDLEALMPTTSAAPQGNPQWIFTGTPPGPRVNGEVFTRTRKDALSGNSKRLSWHEWSCEPGTDMDDRAAWFLANPALGTRLQLDVVEGERARFSDEGFGRERLGMWDDVAGFKREIHDWQWKRLITDDPPKDGRITYGVKFSADGQSVALSVALKPQQGPTHVEVVEHRTTQGGTAWLVDWLEARWRKCDAIVIDGKSGVGELTHALDQRKVSAKAIIAPNVGEIIAAHTMLLNAVREQTVTHFNQDQLNQSVAHAMRRPIGRAGGWGWAPIGDGDVTPLDAVTLAHFGAQTSKRHAGRRTKAVVM